MNVLYFHQHFKTPEGMGGTRSYEMAKHFVDAGHQVSMVYAMSDKSRSSLKGSYNKGVRRGKYYGIDLIEFDLNYSNKLNFLQRTLIFISFSIKSIKLVFKEDFDLVFATSTPLTAGIPGIVMKLFGKKKPFVFEVRDLWPELPREMGVIKNKFILWLMGVLESMSYNKADACIALSPGIEKGIRRKLKKGKPVYLVPNGCDLELFRPGEWEKSIFPGVGEDDLVAIFTGAHGYANGLHAALDAAAVLKEKGYRDNIKLVFIGDGIQKKELVDRATKQELDNCIFMDFVPKKDLFKYLWAADVGMMLLANVPAFYYGTSPNKFFDYISSGLPVINNYPGWLADMIKEHHCGKTVMPDNPNQFADGLIYFYENKSQLKKTGYNGRKLAESRFDRKKLATDLRTALETTIHEAYI